MNRWKGFYLQNCNKILMKTWGAIDVYQKCLECLLVLGPVWKQTCSLLNLMWTCCTKTKTLCLISADNPSILASWLRKFFFSYFFFENTKTAALDFTTVCSWATCCDWRAPWLFLVLFSLFPHETFHVALITCATSKFHLLLMSQVMCFFSEVFLNYRRVWIAFFSYVDFLDSYGVCSPISYLPISCFWKKTLVLF